ncbi:hypothetical protein AGMMS50230_22650 [Spirochaetia bacterium]|nr:hypothetical protein AGMMS50230_22650 [Spirochaetia bacterium]
MKHISFALKCTAAFAAVLLAALYFFSCSTLGISSGQGWSALPPEKRGTALLGTIRVDKNADWDSIEAEAKRLLPLLLAEDGYAALPVYAEEGKTYRIDAILIEREYMENWKTRRSLSAEIRIFGSSEELLSAGKALLSGGKSLSSSKVLYKLVRLALSRALEALGES